MATPPTPAEPKIVKPWTKEQRNAFVQKMQSVRDDRKQTLMNRLMAGALGLLIDDVDPPESPD